MIPKIPGYRSFLLRLWFMKHNGGRIWRATLVNPSSGEQQSFSNLEALNRFLAELGEDLERELEENSLGQG